MSAERAMADAAWGDEGGEAPRKKKRVPSWVWWGCGGGCLLMALVALALAIFFGKMVRDFSDTDKVWEGVGEILPHDERPAGWTALGGSAFGLGQYVLMPGPGTVLQVQRFPSAAALEAMFDPDSLQNRGMMLFESIEDAEAITYELQGREVRALRFRGGIQEKLLGGNAAASSVRLDLSTPKRTATVQISTTESGPVMPERIEELLAPFDVWRGQ
jgi:hypothetical protein